MALMKSLLIFLLAGYLGLVALLYFAQRSLMYFPERARTEPAAAGLPAAEEVVLDSADGERVIAWHIAPRGDPSDRCRDLPRSRIAVHLRSEEVDSFWRNQAG